MKKIFFLFPLFIILFSCSQNLPELNTVSGTVIYDFEDEEKKPDLRLGVFVDVSSDVHRAEFLKIVCMQNDFEWECNRPLKVTNEKKQYAGYANFVMPGNDSFPQGKYTVFYTDANGNEQSCVMNISYSSDILQMSPSNAEEFLKSHNASESLALFDEESVLIFFGDKKDELRNMETVWSRYPQADYARTVWTRNNGKEMCIFPAVYKNGKKVVDENGTDSRDSDTE